MLCDSKRKILRATATTIKRKQREEEIQEYMCRASKTTKDDWGGGGEVWGGKRRSENSSSGQFWMITHGLMVPHQDYIKSRTVMQSAVCVHMLPPHSHNICWGQPLDK